jgi:predicted DCC family thiol-disulfide oxidoreductase YuxK
LTVLFDDDCGFCTRTAALVRRLDARAAIDLVPIREAGRKFVDSPPEIELLDRMHARDATGRWFIGGEAWLRICELVPGLRPLAWLGRLRFVRPHVEPVYGLVAANRHRLSRLLGQSRCRYPTGQS